MPATVAPEQPVAATSQEPEIKSFAEDIAEGIAAMTPPEDDGTIAGDPLEKLTQAAKEHAPESVSEEAEPLEEDSSDSPAVDSQDKSENNTADDEPDGYVLLADRYDTDASILRSQFSTPKDAENALAMQDLLIRQLGRQQYADQGYDPRQEAATQQQTTSQSASSDDNLDLAALEDLDKSDPLRKTLETIVAQNKQLSERVHQQEQYVRAVEEKRVRERAEQVAAEFRSIVDSLDTEIYGKGGEQPTAAQMRNYQILVEEVNLDAETRINKGLKLPSLKELANRVHHGLFHQLITQEQIKKNHAKSRERAGGKLGSPARSRGGATSSNDQITESWQDDPVFQRAVRAIRSGSTR